MIKYFTVVFLLVLLLFSTQSDARMSASFLGSTPVTTCTPTLVNNLNQEENCADVPGTCGWSSQTDTSSLVISNSASKLHGTNYGLAVTMDTTNPGWWNYALPSVVDTVRFRFYVNLLPLTTTAGDYMSFIRVQRTSVGLTAIFLGVQNISGTLYWCVFGYDDTGTAHINTYGSTANPVGTLSADHYVEVMIVTETSDGSADGKIYVWFDQASPTEGNANLSATTVDNYVYMHTSVVTLAAGLISGNRPGSSGTVYLDEFYITSNDCAIGP